VSAPEARAGATVAAAPAAAAGPVPFAEAVRVWVRVALQSFGGPAGQIAVMHRILVAEKRWLSERRFLHALNYCMLLPGPEATQLAIYVGWLLHGTRGGLVAGSLFVLPGFLSILALSALYAAFQGGALLQALFFGLKAGVLAVVVDALLRIARRALHGRLAVALAVGAFVAIALLEVPFPWVVLGAALAGFAAGRADRHAGAPSPEGERGLLDDLAAPSAVPTIGRALRVLAVGLSAWLVPVALLALALGGDHVLVELAVFFSQVAVASFGGAYAVLTWVAQAAVEQHGWMTPGEVLDGLGLAETTPGPLIQVVQFVGYLAAWRAPAPFAPWVAALAGSLVVTWVTYVPCFLWIFLGAPYIESLRGRRRLAGALAGITAAVVGVIASLALWFGLHVLFGSVPETHVGPVRIWVPRPETLDLGAAALAVASVFALVRLRLGMGRVLLGSTLLGMAWALVRGGAL
jgi:chromate transporter